MGRIIFSGPKPSYTKIDKDREITVTIQNKDFKSPLKIPEGIEMVTVTTVEKRIDHFSLHEYQAARTIFNQILRVQIIECYCHRPRLEKTKINIYIEASDPMEKHPQGIIVILTVLWSLTHQGCVFLDITKRLHTSEDKKHSPCYLSLIIQGIMR